MDTRNAPLILAATAQPDPRPAPSTVHGHYDDAAVAPGWFAALAAEGLAVRCQPIDGGRTFEQQPQARILHLTRGLPPHLARLRGWHATAPRVPLLAVCVALRDLDHVLALEMGADDVIDAALPAPVVAARLRALWRRCGTRLEDGDTQPEQLCFGSLHLHRGERQAVLHQRSLSLTEGEFDVLWLLALRAGHAVPRTDLVRRLRGLEYQRDDRSIDCRVYRIRAKLGDNDPAARRIRTVRNSGYLFSTLPW